MTPVAELVDGFQAAALESHHEVIKIDERSFGAGVTFVHRIHLYPGVELHWVDRLVTGDAVGHLDHFRVREVRRAMLVLELPPNGAATRKSTGGIVTMIKHLEAGSVLAATFIAGIEETPRVVGTLKLDDERGVRVFIPFVQGSKEFESVEAWFDGQKPPPHLSVIGNNLRIGLFGCGFSGLTSNTPHGTAEGHIDAEEAVLKERDGEFSDPLRVKEVTSEIDGLYEWAQLKSVTTDHSAEGDGWSLTNTLAFTVKTAQGLVWRQGDATLSVSTTFNWSSGRGINLEEKAVLRSAFDLPRSFHEHLVEQRKFVTFLSLMFGTSLSFRGHRVRADRYTTKTMAGQIMDYPSVELISRQTIREYSKPLPPKKELDHPLVRMPHLQSESLSRWSDNYDQ